jgi:NAD-dependent deacetylase
MHGELLKARCTTCKAVADWRNDLGVESTCPACDQSGPPCDRMWSGSAKCPSAWRDRGGADLGRPVRRDRHSGSVYPAAGFVAKARIAGIGRCEINLEPSDNARLFNERRYGPAGEAVPAWVEEMLAS